MVETICRENLQKEGQEFTKAKRSLPKNIRQVGSPRGRHKIYIEDYVYTYIKNMARKKDPCAAIFLGTAQVDKDIRCTFVSGAVECGAAIFQWDKVQLDDSFWDYIYKEKKQYFPDLEIVGWFLGRGGQPMDLPASVESAHRKYFAGRDKLLMLMDILEGEEVFFIHEQGYLQKREGYYIYYEKNLPMQEYMVCKHEEELQMDRLEGLGDTGYGAEYVKRSQDGAVHGEFGSNGAGYRSGYAESSPKGAGYGSEYAESSPKGAGYGPEYAESSPKGTGYGLEYADRSPKGAELADLWNEIETGESRAMPRTGEFADLYQELQQAEPKAVEPKLFQETPAKPEKSAFQEIPGGQKKKPSLEMPEGHRQQLRAAEMRNAAGSKQHKGIQEENPEASKAGWQEKSPAQSQKLFQEILGIQGRNAGKADPAGAYREQEKEESLKTKEMPVRDQAKGLREKSASRRTQTERAEKKPANIFSKNNGKEPKTPAEKVLESYHNLAVERHGRQIARQNRNFLYTASSFFLVILCVIGITTINNYRKMQEVEETLHILKATEEERESSADRPGAGSSGGESSGSSEKSASGSSGEEGSQAGSDGEEGLVVESIASQVTPLEEQDKQEPPASQGAASDSAQPKSSKDTGQASAGQERVRYYTVQPGDTLDSICKSIYNSLDVREELCQLNGLQDGNKIFVGQKLQLP